MNRAQKKSELKVYGLNACLALFEKRSADILKVYYAAERKARLGRVLQFCSQRKLPQKRCSAPELGKITETAHHEGVCIVAKRMPEIGSEQFLEAGKGKTFVVLDGVENPHNLGAILRVSAHFGVDAVFVTKKAAPLLSGAAMRVAQGGAEHVPVIGCKSMADTLVALKKSGYQIIGTGSGTREKLYQQSFPEKIAIIFGAEGTGISKEVATLCTKIIEIPGTGKVESLNVAAAVAATLGERWRQTK